MKQIMKIGTHNGAFHCDEVLACAMLKQLPEYKEAEIVRTRDQALLDECDIVVDVGGIFDPKTHRYDHHQKTFVDTVSSLIPDKPFETKLSSAGLVYVHFGKKLIAQLIEKPEDHDLTEKIFDKVYEKFMEEVDANDNGIATHDGKARYAVTTTLASRVANLRPHWNDPEQDFDKGFYKAMNLAWPELEERIHFYAKVWWPAREIVAKALENRFNVHSSGKILLLDNGGCPFKEHLYELEEEQGISGEILYVLFADQSGNWRVLAVGCKDEGFKSRLALPEEWRALRDQDLSDKSGIKDCIFAHASGFIGGNKTKEGALEMAVKSLKIQGIKVLENSS